ncbi:MAG: hypothetical protein WC795_02950 [Candidatus Paceibacterota bacterium]
METYNQTIKIATDYLGPAAERFIARQVAAHLKKNPKDLTKEDLLKLTEWLRISISLLTEDQKMVDECIGRIQSLAV